MFTTCFGYDPFSVVFQAAAIIVYVLIVQAGGWLAFVGGRGLLGLGEHRPWPAGVGMPLVGIGLSLAFFWNIVVSLGRLRCC